MKTFNIVFIVIGLTVLIISIIRHVKYGDQLGAILGWIAAVLWAIFDGLN